MKETGKNQEIDNLIAEEMKKAFGYDNESLIAEFDRAAEEMEDADQILPEGEFDKIMATARKRASKKVVRLKRLGKIGLMVAILGCMLMGTGIGASGKRAYEYTVRESDLINGNIRNNVEYIESEIEVEDAYKKIKNELGIDVLRLKYIPESMCLTKLEIGMNYARLEFMKDNKYIYFLQSQYPVENSGGTVSDREINKSEIVTNNSLKIELEINKNLLSNKLVEYSTEFVIDKTYYYIAGVVSEKEFERVAKKICH